MRTGARLSGLALIASSLPGAAAAQEPTIESRFVQAFQTYCMASAADPKRVKADLKEFYVGRGLDLLVGEAPVHIHFDEPPGYPRTCSVRTWYYGITYQRIRATLERDLGLGAGESIVIPERRQHPTVGPTLPRTELTRWKTRLDDTEAEIELHPPTHSLQALRLQLSVRRNVGWSDLLRYFNWGGK